MSSPTPPTSDTLSARATELASSALTDYAANRTDAAVRSLREAISIAPQNPAVLLAFQKIQEDHRTHGLVKLCQRLVMRGDRVKDKEVVGDALRMVKEPGMSLTTSVAEECLGLLLVGGRKREETEVDKEFSEGVGKVLAGILEVSRGGREFMADRIGETTSVSSSSSSENEDKTQAKELLDLFWDFGENAVEAFVGLLADPTAWRSKDKRMSSIRVYFKLFLSQLKSSSSSEPSPSKALTISIKPIARLLATSPETVHHLIDQSSFDLLLSSFHPSSSPELRSHATLAIAKYIESSGEVAQNMLRRFLVLKIEGDTDEDLIIAFSAAAAIFPLVQGIAAQLLSTEGFAEGIVPVLQGRGQEVERAALKMLAAACGEQSCRATIKQTCGNYLEAVLKSDVEDHSDIVGEEEPSLRALAALTLAKLRYGTGDGPVQDIDELAGVFKNMMIKKEGSSQREAIEGLAYASLQSSVKDSLVKNKEFIKSLINVLNKSIGNPTATYGGLTIVQNLTTYPPTLSEEQKKIAQLKNYANAAATDSQPNNKGELDPLEKDEVVTARCKVLLNAGIMSVLVSLSKKISPSAMAIVSGTVLSLAKNQKHRGLIAQQGGVKLMIQFYTSVNTTSSTSSSTQDSTSNLIMHLSSHALARILVSVNPSHIFTSQLPLTTAIRPLLTLLNSEHPSYQSSPSNSLLPTFESLLALTNLASTDDPSTRDLILRLAFSPYISDLLLHNQTQIQRAACELVCNLTPCPTGISLYADGSKEAKQRLHILLALADAEDFATRRAAGGALAVVTEWEGAKEGVVGREGGVEVLLGMVGEEGQDGGEMVHRGVVCLSNLVCPGEEEEGVGDGVAEVRRRRMERVKKVKEKGGVEVLTEAMKRTRVPDVLQIGVEALRVLLAK